MQALLLDDPRKGGASLGLDVVRRQLDCHRPAHADEIVDAVAFRELAGSLREGGACQFVASVQITLLDHQLKTSNKRGVALGDQVRELELALARADAAAVPSSVLPRSFGGWCRTTVTRSRNRAGVVHPRKQAVNDEP